MVTWCISVFVCVSCHVFSLCYSRLDCLVFPLKWYLFLIQVSFGLWEGYLGLSFIENLCFLIQSELCHDSKNSLHIISFFFYPCRVHMFRRIVRVLCPSVPCRVSCLCPWYLDNVSYGIQPVYLSLTLFTHQHSCIFTFGTIYTDQSFDIVTQIHCIHILYMYAE